MINSMKKFNITDYIIQQQLKEEYGGPGPMDLPDNHKAGMKVPKGGSCCANCRWWDKENQVCTSTYYAEWAGTNKIPYAADEYCTNWWEPANALSEIRVNKPLDKAIKQAVDDVLDYMDNYYYENEIVEDDIYAILKDPVIISLYLKYPQLQRIPFERIFSEVLQTIKEDPKGYVFIDEDINEIKVNKPMSLSKEQILNYFFERNIYILRYLTIYDSLQELYNSFGYNSLNDFLIDTFGYYDNNNNSQLNEKGEEVKKYIIAYYARFKPNEILVDIFGDGDGTSVSSLICYKNIEIIYLGDREYVLYCHN